MASGWRLTDVDLLVALAGFVVLLIDPVFSDRSDLVTPVAGLLALSASAPLVARRRHPLGVLAVEVPALMACLAVFHPDWAAVLIVMLMVFTIASTGQRRRSLVVGALMAPVVAAAVLLTSRNGGSADVIAYLAVILGALIAGDAIHTRQRVRSLVVEEQEKERAAAAQRLFDEDRLALAHELHDVVGHALVAINMSAAGAALLHRKGREADLPVILDEIARTSADALSELRSTIRMLRFAGDHPAPLQPVQSLDDLAALVARTEQANLRVQLTLHGSLDVIPAPVGHAAFRIIQESLTNVLRHSTARCAVVTVTVGDADLTVEVADDGRPTSTGRHQPTGHGLQGMRERAATLGGTMHAGPIDGGGWRVTGKLPIVDRRTP